MKKCLVVVDMQKDFITGSLGTSEAKAIVNKVKTRISKAIKENEDIIFTKDTHDNNYLLENEGKFLPIKHCIKGTEGHDICDELVEFTKDAKHIIEKNTFGSKNLPKLLEDYEEITFIGLCTDICVISNAIITKAFYPNINIILEKDLCAGSNVENHESALKVLKSCHINIV